MNAGAQPTLVHAGLVRGRVPGKGYAGGALSALHARPDEDCDEHKMRMLATLEAAEDADAVDTCFRAI